MVVTTNPDYDPVAVCLFWEDLADHYKLRGARNTTEWFSQDPEGYKRWFEGSNIPYIAATSWIACSRIATYGNRRLINLWCEWGRDITRMSCFNAALADYAIDQLGRGRSLDEITVGLRAAMQLVDSYSVAPLVGLLADLTAKSPLNLEAHVTPAFMQACSGGQDLIYVWKRVGCRDQIDAVVLAEEVGASRLGAYQTAAQKIQAISLPDLIFPG
jgi:hypothetical protein